MSAEQITTADIFVDSLFDLIASGASRDVVYKEFGGSSIYILIQNKLRDQDIVKDYKQGMSYLELQK